MTTESNSNHIVTTGPATGILPVPHRKPITVIGNNSIRAGFDARCIQQAINSASAPGVSQLVLNPDAHAGYGAPVGCVMVSPTHIYPGPVGVDIKCSMSLLQMNIPSSEINDRRVRREIINAILMRLPTGAGRGQRSAPRSRRVNPDLGYKALVEGASAEVCYALGIPAEWASRCEDSFHVGHDDSSDALALRLDQLLRASALGDFAEKISQLGSYGGGNHFGECEVVQLSDDDSAAPVADVFGLKHDHVAFLSHCGSRGIGHKLASGQFRALQGTFKQWDIPLPGNPREGSVVMVATEGAHASCYSVNHGAGRRMGRKEATRQLDQTKIDDELNQHDILTNCRTYPKDEAPDAYKDFGAVLSSVEDAGLAKTVAKLKARFVIKDNGASDD